MSVRAWLDAAEDEAMGWSDATAAYVMAHKPAEHSRLQVWGWALAVAACRRPQESPEQACDRLTSYVATYRERHGVTLSTSALIRQERTAP